MRGLRTQVIEPIYRLCNALSLLQEKNEAGTEVEIFF